MPSNRATPPTKRSVSASGSQAPSPHRTTSTSPNSVSGTGLTQAQLPNTKPTVTHKPHRPHVVGGANRVNSRNLSQKNLNKLQRLALAHNVSSELDGPHQSSGIRHHQRKKSAPSSPATSPRVGSHVRWNGSVVALTGHSSNPALKKNLSTPTLKHDGSRSPVIKKAQLLKESGKLDKPLGKKTVGFEFADSDEDEWEDHSSQSPASTRRNSLTSSSKINGDSNLHTSLTFNKSPLVQQNNVTDMKNPQESIAGGRHAQQQQQLNGPTQQQRHPSSSAAATTQVQTQPQTQTHDTEHEEASQRLLLRSVSSKAPPEVSSILVTATPKPAEPGPRASASFANLTNLKATPNQSNARDAPVRTSPNATSSSTEAGVSRFLISHPTSSTLGGPSESDFSAPSSLLPHYQPRTPPSPEVAGSRLTGSPTSSRRPGAEPHSRTQQKLWLQRTATLSTSPSETALGALAPTVPPSVVVQNPPLVSHSRTNSGLYSHEAYRPVIAAAGSSAGPVVNGEAKRAKKLYERFSVEYSVMHRFRDPVVDSLHRLREMSKSQTGREDSLTRPNSSSSMPNQRRDTRAVHSFSGFPTRPKGSARNGTASSSQVRFQEQDDMVNIVDIGNQLEQTYQGQRPPSSEAIDPTTYDDQDERLNEDVDKHVQQEPAKAEQLTEDQMLMRRIWASREVAVPGD